MTENQKRVLVDQKELAEKINKLTIFITDKDSLGLIDAMEYDIIYDQLLIMLQYSSILLIRIRNFNL